MSKPLPRSDAQVIEAGHLAAIGRLKRVLIREEAAHRTLRREEQEFRELRTMQCASQINRAEAVARRITEDVKAAITLWFDSLEGC